MEGEITSVKTSSQNSQYALVNNAPHVRASWLLMWAYLSLFQEIQLWDLKLGKLARKYIGQRQERHVIRSCFGGIEDNFVVSGSEGIFQFGVCRIFTNLETQTGMCIFGIVKRVC